MQSPVLGGWLGCDTVMRSNGWVRPLAIRNAASKTSKQGETVGCLLHKDLYKQIFWILLKMWLTYCKWVSCRLLLDVCCQKGLAVCKGGCCASPRFKDPGHLPGLPMTRKMSRCTSLKKSQGSIRIPRNQATSDPPFSADKRRHSSLQQSGGYSLQMRFHSHLYTSRGNGPLIWQMTNIRDTLTSSRIFRGFLVCANTSVGTWPSGHQAWNVPHGDVQSICCIGTTGKAVEDFVYHSISADLAAPKHRTMTCCGIAEMSKFRNDNSFTIEFKKSKSSLWNEFLFKNQVGAKKITTLVDYIIVGSHKL